MHIETRELMQEGLETIVRVCVFTPQKKQAHNRTLFNAPIHCLLWMKIRSFTYIYYKQQKKSVS